jgi:transcriptional regulator with XRE-family HTH domain
VSRSKGAVMFARLGSTQAQLASRLSVSTGIVAMWNSGQRKPSLPNRKLLLERFKIPIESWDEDPVAVHEAPPKPPRPVSSWGEKTVLGRIETLERIVEDTLDRVESDAEMTLLEQAKVMNLLGRTLGELRRLKGEEVAEVRVLRHPKWLDVKTALLAALEPHPDALDSVIVALEQLDKKSA